MRNRDGVVRFSWLRGMTWSVAITASLALSGCGGPAAPNLGKPFEVKGKITMDGEPAAGVDVLFSRMGGNATPETRQFSAKTTASGEYAIPKIYAGEYHVMVYDPVEQKKQEEEASAVETGKYKDYGINSTLTAKVGEGQTTFDFELKSSN
jgi:hypothetical protein